MMTDSAKIAGSIPDVKFVSSCTEITPMAFLARGARNWGSRPNWAYTKVKVGPDLRAATGHVRSAVRTLDPEYPSNIRFFNQVLNDLYKKEGNLSSLITLFGLCAIFISTVGVFGLVVSNSERRKKEIGVHKVLGSTTGGIIVMFNETYVRILCIYFVLGAPTAGYAAHRWLENFAYKTPVYRWVYLIAFTPVSIITILTVAFQSWHAVNENPVHSIKNE